MRYLYIFTLLTVYIKGQEITEKRCNCYMPGTFETPDGSSLCDEITGSCSCLKNVVGIDCDVCKDGYYGILSGKGCKFCACNMIGAVRQRCDEIYGKCQCKPGYMGHKCEKCSDDIPIIGESCCNCPEASSYRTGCDKIGKCRCKPHTSGEKCTICDHNHYYSNKTGCTECGPCYAIVNRQLEAFNVTLESVVELVKEANTTEDFDKSLHSFKKEIMRWDFSKVTIGGVITELEKELDELLERSKNVPTARKRIAEIRKRIKIPKITIETNRISELKELLEEVVAETDKLELPEWQPDATLHSMKSIENRTRNALDDRHREIQAMQLEVAKLNDFIGKIRAVKEEVVIQKQTALSFKKKASRLKATDIDLDTGNPDFLDSVKARVSKFDFTTGNLGEVEKLKGQIAKIQDGMDYIESVRRQNEEIVKEFGIIQTKFNFKDILKKVDEIKTTIEELSKSQDSVRRKFDEDLIPRIEKLKQSTEQLSQLDDLGINQLIEELRRQHEKFDTELKKNQEHGKNAIILLSQLQLEDNRLQGFMETIEAVEELLEASKGFEEDLREKIAICEDLITILNAMPFHEHNSHVLVEAEEEIVKLELYFAQLDQFRKVKANLELDVDRLERILEGFPEEKNWCNVVGTLT